MKVFPENSLLTEEFLKIKQLAAEECSGQPGRDAMQKLFPGTDFSSVLVQLEETNEFRELIITGDYFPIENYPDISNELKLLGIKNSVLTVPQVLLISKIVELIKQVFDFFKEKQEKYPLLFRHLNDTTYEPAILKEIDQIIDENNVVRNSASPELARIRKLIARKRTEAAQIYQSVLQKYRKNNWLTDSEESWRGGRRVISIYAEHKRSAKGIMHDLSSSGKTCFIEPEEAIAVNNSIIEFEEDEREEIKKILKELTEFLRKHHAAISKYAAHIATYDVIAAKANLAVKMDAHLPFIENKPVIDFINARHPLLYIYNKSAGKITIPFDLQLKDKNRILVISGPNAGGKTVAMKTVGLLQILLQSGFLVTTDSNSHMGFFNDLLVDIGDSQSLEFELSTYSSRLRNMKMFLQRATSSTLFLIDEFGTGTDPALGGALAESILEELNFKKSFGIVTTHYMNLKVLADRTEGIINGSMAFDAKKLLPMFRLEVGKPGSSYTFVVAERSGLAYSVINRAKKKVKKNSLLLEETLTRLEREKSELRKLLEQNKAEEKKLKELLSRYEKNVQQQEQKIQTDDERIRQRELRLSTQLEDKFKRFVRDWRDAKNKKLVLEKYNTQLSDRKKVLSAKDQQNLEELIQFNKKHIRKGSKVRLKNGRVTGVVEAIDGQKISIVFGNVKTVADLANLVYIEEKK